MPSFTHHASASFYLATLNATHVMVRAKFRGALLTICSTFSFICSGQVVIEGTVSDDSSGETLIGASVVVKGTTIGVQTDFDGNFNLEVSEFPVTLVISFVGYQQKEVLVSNATKPLKVKLSVNQVVLKQAEVVGSRISDKQKQAPMTVETMDVIAIKEAASGDFYESLGALKGVDMTAASMGFKVINTRGFNSTSPVRSLQLIDGVDNQSPGLNFSLGNFLGASDLDVMKVDIVAGASSAFYGPGAFNGVINMTTKNPFLFPGFSMDVTVGERSQLKTAIRNVWIFNNKDSVPRSALKLNAFWMQAQDWEATNLAPTEESLHDESNPGGYDAVNRYGDEQEFRGGNSSWGLRSFYRNGYEEVDLVDYDTRNLKLGMAYHHKIKDSLEIIAASNYSTGSTMYQGDNRFRLENVQFFQHRLELMKENDFFIRTYVTHEDAGDSYDAVFTAFRLQDRVKDDNSWFRDYTNFWNSNGYSSQVLNSPGFPQPVFDPGPPPTFIIDQEAIDAWYLQNNDYLTSLHDSARAFANSSQTSQGTGNNFEDRLEPGSEEFNQAFDEITSTYFSDGGTRFFDRSVLWNAHAQKEFEIDSTFFTAGASFRQYLPDSRGNIFSDTAGVKIRNSEGGAYVGASRKVLPSRKLKMSGSLRVDKNQNFPAQFTYNLSNIYNFDQNNLVRVTLTSAIRNPTLQDQYLFYNVGRAILLGNLEGVNDLVTIESLREALASSADALEYFDVAPIEPEKVETIELGFRTTIGKKLFVDGSAYYSRYRDFIGFQIGADVRVNTINQVDLSSIQVYRVAANAASIVTTQGLNVGANYYFSDNYVLAGNYSWNRLNTKEDDPIVPAFNTPEHKYNIGFSGRDLSIAHGESKINNLSFNVNYKWIEGFLFEGSPQFTGTIDSYGLVDAQVSKMFKSLNTRVKIGASNVLDNQVYMVYGGPLVGRLAYISLLYEVR